MDGNNNPFINDIEIPDVVIKKTDAAFSMVRKGRSEYVNEVEKIHGDIHEKQVIGRRSHAPWGVAAAAVLIAVLLVIPSPVSSFAKESIKQMANHINDLIYGPHEDITRYTTYVEQTERDGDLTVTLNDVLVDGSQMTFSYTVTNDNPVFQYVEDDDNTGGTLVDFYDLVVKRITINGRTREYIGDDFDPHFVLLEGQTAWSGDPDDVIDNKTYPVMGTLSLNEFADVLENEDEALNVSMDIVAVQWGADMKEFSYAFQLTNRELASDTKEIPIEQTVRIDDVTMKLDKLVINSYSQKVYFNIEGVPDQSYRSDIGTKEERYAFYIEGKDEKGNRVCGEVEEIIDGYGYINLVSLSDETGLRSDVKCYDFQLSYDYMPPVNDKENYEETVKKYHREGKLGDEFRVDCRQEN
ncbi:MAG: DUF4179 domain-containing protein [Lachnospiraceae bacterium]|nr:DUF4179 domain-containing protein [Lachnospiraceae bacterium]